MTDFASFEAAFLRATAALPYASLRRLSSRSRSVSVRRGNVEPPQLSQDAGWMLTVVADAQGSGGGPCGIAYAASAEFSEAALERGLLAAKRAAALAAGRSVCDFRSVPFSHASGTYEGPSLGVEMPLETSVDLLRRVEAGLAGSPLIADRSASLSQAVYEQVTLTNRGGRIVQRFRRIHPSASVTALKDGLSQTRSWQAGSCLLQGGAEILAQRGFESCGPQLVEEVLELLAAPPCPDEVMDLILMPDQMHLQIHESIGHPLELDRILGDERNYAGTSFVTLDMFGKYQYGSELLNVSFDPGLSGEGVSCAFDDEGSPAEKVMLIERGLLKNPLGGIVSQTRSGHAGTANSRAQTWNRPPMDRMGNVNLEAGSTPFPAMIAQVERGVIMSGNRSWSIDDSRNKFQFGCEHGRLIIDGQLGPVVRDAAYRGISSSFWRALKAVGDADSFRVLGVGNCGKGEFNQLVTVGHASPPCLFAGVQVMKG